MERLCVMIERIAVKFVFALGVAIFFAFTFWAQKYRHELPMDLSSERVQGYLDSLPRNLFAIVLFFLTVVFMGRFLLGCADDLKRKRVQIFAVSVTVILGVGLTVWVSICHISPVWDQLQVFYGAMEFHRGEYSLMESYYDTYPHQYGLTFIYDLLADIFKSTKPYQYINVVFVMVIIYFVYLISDELFLHNAEINYYTLVCTLLFVPLPLYVNYVYGELWNMAFGVIAIWSMLKTVSAKSWKYGMLSTVSMVIAYVARKNVVVWAIAIALVLFVYSIRHLDTKMAIYATVIVAIPTLALQLVLMSYEHRSGKEIGQGSPDVTSIAMGLHDSWAGAGYYDAYNNMVYINDANRDVELAKQLAYEDIRKSVSVFRTDMGYARNFFQRKIWQQWNEGTYNALVMTATFDEEPVGIVANVYYGKLEQKIYEWTNYYLFIMYFFITVFMGIKLWKETKIEQCVLVIALLGGFCFSIIWEAKARYMFPYTALMFPCMAAGIYYVKQGICIAINCWKNNK